MNVRKKFRALMNGKRLVLRIMRGQTSETNSFARIADGRSEVLSLSDG